MRARLIGLGVCLALCGPSAMAVSAERKPAPISAPGILKASQGRLPAFLTCLREQKVALIGAHRGGPLPEYPENALATLERTVSMIPVFLEVDVQQSFDDQLLLNHDPVLERNTAGHGTISEMRWASISKLKLRDQTGQPTEYTAPLLKDALAWADGRALLLLDVKPRTDQQLLIDTIREAGAIDRVMFLSYTIRQALTLRKIHPEAVIALPIFDQRAFDAAQGAGLLNDRLVAMVRPDNVGPEFIARLEALGVSVMSGSYGSKASPDAQYRGPADAGVYHALAGKGARLIVSNRPHEASAAMLADRDYVKKLRACGVK